MTWIDYVILTLVLCSALISLIRGFIQETLSLLTWGSAFFIAGHFYYYLAGYFMYFKNEIVRNSLAMIICFIMTLIIGAISNYVMHFLVEKTGISVIDRVFGLFFGVLRGILIVAIILFSIENFTIFSHNQDWKQSQLIPLFQYTINWFYNYLHNMSRFF